MYRDPSKSKDCAASRESCAHFQVITCWQAKRFERKPNVDAYWRVAGIVTDQAADRLHVSYCLEEKGGFRPRVGDSSRDRGAEGAEK